MSQSRPSIAFHAFSIVMTISTILLGTLFYLNKIELDKARQSAAVFEAQNTQLTRQILDFQDNEQAIKNALSYQHSSIGTFDSVDPLTVLGHLRADLDELGLSPNPQNLHEALAQWKHEKDQNHKSENSLQSQVTELRNLVNTLESRWMALLDVEKKNNKDTKKELADVLTAQTEKMESKNREINDYRQSLSKVQQQLSLLEAEYQAKSKDWTDREKLMHNTITRMRDQLATLKGEINLTEEPDAEIIKMEGFTRTVWLNRGSRDLLKPGIVFVITSSRPADKGKEKGRVKVTKILGEHMAEAAIIDTKNGTPLAGDHLISSLWSPGQVEKFVLTGFFDIDDDGKSDLESLLNFINSSGAEVVAYCDEQGNHQGNKFDENVTALVIGAIPDPTLAKTDKSKTQANGIMTHSTLMRKSADDYGTETLHLKKFLQQIGYPTAK